MRLFVAIDLPDDVKASLAALRKKFPSENLVFSGEFHITLFFLGEVPEDRAEKIKKALRKIHASPFSLSIGNLGFFGKGKWTRVIWVDVSREPALLNLQQQVQNTLGYLGFFSERRAFHPHVTLARVRCPVSPDFQQKFSHIRAPKCTFSVSSFVLMRSHLSPRGAKYEVIDSFPFR